uniref:Uncharacterized protein n=1 Tax=Romanomermis culicivorax TaxID=13658 RepID=A0A915JVX5_ROMCU
MAQKSLLSCLNKPVENDISHQNEETQEVVNEDIIENLLEISDTETGEVDTEVTTTGNKKCKIDMRIRQYNFKHNWLKQFNWLHLIDLKSKKVYCPTCKEEKVLNAWAPEKLFATWRALKKKILDYGYVLLLHTIADLLEPLNRLMLHFQYNIVHPFDVNIDVKYEELVARSQLPGESVSAFAADATEEHFEEIEDQIFKTIFEGRKVKSDGIRINQVGQLEALDTQACDKTIKIVTES